jgi:Domain of unknown function (DUF222)
MPQCLDRVRGGMLGCLDDEGLTQALREVEALSRRTHAVLLELVAELDSRGIAETIAALPASVPDAARERAEADLAGYARDFDPRRLRLIARRILATLDPDGSPPADEPTPATPARGELWLRDRRDGRLALEGWLDSEHGSMIRALIEQLAARRPSTDGVPDPRTVPQRQADALIELCERARATDEFLTTAGESPHLTVTTSPRCRPRDAHRSAGSSPRPGCPRWRVQFPRPRSTTRTVRRASRETLGRRRRDQREKLLPAVPGAPSTSAFTELGHHHQRRARRIPTAHHHQPRPPPPHQPPPPLTTRTRVRRRVPYAPGVAWCHVDAWCAMRKCHVILQPPVSSGSPSPCDEGRRLCP